MKIVNKAYLMELADLSGSIKSFSNVRKEFIYSDGSVPLFILQLRDELGKPVKFSASDASSIDIVREEIAGDENIRIRYTKIGNHPLNANVTIRCPKDSSMTYWRIDHEYVNNFM